MRKKNYKGRCEKRALSKCIGVCRTYDALQYAYSDMLEGNEEVKEFQCNVPLSSEEYRLDEQYQSSSWRKNYAEIVYVRCEEK